MVDVKSGASNQSSSSSEIKASATSSVASVAKVSSTYSVSPQVAPKATKPIETRINMKGGEKPMATKKAAVDPTGEFDYSKAVAYQVQEGDTLFSVAQKFLVAMQQLRYFNHIRPGRNLRVGKTIYIPKEPINVPVGK